MGYCKQLAYSVSVFYGAYGNCSSSIFAVLGFFGKGVVKDAF